MTISERPMTQVKEKLLILSSPDKTMSSTSGEYSAGLGFTFHVLPFQQVKASWPEARCSKSPFSKAAASEGPEAYHLGRTVRRIRSTTSVRAAE